MDHLRFLHSHKHNHQFGMNSSLFQKITWSNKMTICKEMIIELRNKSMELLVNNSSIKIIKSPQKRQIQKLNNKQQFNALNLGLSLKIHLRSWKTKLMVILLAYSDCKIIQIIIHAAHHKVEDKVILKFQVISLTQHQDIQLLLRNYSKHKKVQYQVRVLISINLF